MMWWRGCCASVHRCDDTPPVVAMVLCSLFTLKGRLWCMVQVFWLRCFWEHSHGERWHDFILDVVLEFVRMRLNKFIHDLLLHNYSVAENFLNLPLFNSWESPEKTGFKHFSPALNLPHVYIWIHSTEQLLVQLLLLWKKKKNMWLSCRKLEFIYNVINI